MLQVAGVLAVVAGAGIAADVWDSDVTGQGHSLATQILAVVVTVVAGAATPLQANVNRRCSEAVGGALRGALVNFSVGVVGTSSVAAVYLGAVAPDARAALSLSGARPWMFCGGAFGAFGISMNILLPPLIGLTLSFACQVDVPVRAVLEEGYFFSAKDPRRLSANRRGLTLNRRQLTLNRRQLTLNRRQLTLNRQQLTLNRRQLTLNRRRLALSGWPMTDRSYSPAGANKAQA